MASAADVTSVTIVSTNSGSQSNVPVTFGQVFKVGEVPANAVLGFSNGTPLQVDKKATHADGSLRHAVLTTVLPTLGGSASQVLTITNSGTAPSGGPIALSSLLATAFDATINLSVGGTAYSASARSLLQTGTPPTWLSGPLATEWLVTAPFKSAAGASLPLLLGRFYVRA